MNPAGGGKPTGMLAEQIKRDFGSYEAFKNQFTEAANKVEGSGWAMLVWSPRAHRLEILQAEKHQNLSQSDIVPLLPLDVWEHAYYLKHQNERKSTLKTGGMSSTGLLLRNGMKPRVSCSGRLIRRVNPV